MQKKKKKKKKKRKRKRKTYSFFYFKPFDKAGSEENNDTCDHNARMQHMNFASVVSVSERTVAKAEATEGLN